MQPCIVKQPIHNAQGEIWANELLYSSAGSDARPSDAEAAAALQSLLLQCNNENFLEDKVAFVTFTENLMRHNVPKMFAPESLVLQIDHDFILHPDAMGLVRSYHEEGYRVALIGFDFNSMYLSVLNTVDFVKLNFQSPRFSHQGSIDVLKSLGKEIIGYRVDDPEAYARAAKCGVTSMQGSYIASTLPATVRSVDLIPANFFRLIVAITSDEPDFEEIEEIISRDVTLTYSLLKLINSAYFALRSRVTSVHQALVILGLEQLKQWVYLLSFNPDGRTPIEFMKTSLMRASFSQALCGCIPDFPISKAEAYLMGMFSTLGSLLQVPLAQALGELALSDDVRNALLTGSGPCGLLYQLVLSYEKADWHLISDYAEQLGISRNLISQKYFECMDSVNETWKKIAQSI